MILKKKIVWSTLLILLILCGIAAYFLLKPAKYTVAAFWLDSNDTNSAQIDHSQWQTVLDEYLITDDPSGINRVDYANLLTEDKEQLVAYINSLAQLDPRLYSRAEQFAYWVNLYNALTVNLILNHYPIDSITNLGQNSLAFGPWDDSIISIAGQTLSLNDIEHRILRPIWKDYRIHFAVNCASIGCPNLQAIAYTVSETENLLNQAASEYLRHSRGIQFDEDDLILSSIFDWYKDDFGHNTSELLNTLSKHVDAELAEKLKGYKGRIQYHYNWDLNGQVVN